MSIAGIRFVGEQDGIPEQLLKTRLVARFKRHATVQRAYLAQINVGDKPGVALCLRSDAGPDRHLVLEIGAIFAGIFGAHEHLDVLFVTELQELDLKRLCPAFYEL
jgi:hypothetical protein